MYQYDKYDQAMVDARVAEFREQTRRRIEGHLTDHLVKEPAEAQRQEDLDAVLQVIKSYLK